MTVWELRCASINDYAMVISLSYDESVARRFDVNGKPKHWMNRPMVGLADNGQRNNPRPPADVSAMVPGAFVLNERAKRVLGPFLSKFGQLLELDCEGSGETRYFYNVTNIVPCVDVERSEKSGFGDVKFEAFDEPKVPDDPAVFKDPSTVNVRIYINDAGKKLVDQLAASAALTGIECGPLAPLLW
jgi:hypothetical protein